MLSPNFQVAAFQVEEYNEQPISISYKFAGSDKVVTKDIFKKGSSFPSTKSVTFDNKAGDCDLMIHYSENAQLPEGIPSNISKYQIEKAKVGDKTEKHQFTMRVKNNIHNVVSLDEAELVEEWTEEYQVAIKSAPTV